MKFERGRFYSHPGMLDTVIYIRSVDGNKLRVSYYHKAGWAHNAQEEVYIPKDRQHLWQEWA